MKGHSIKNKYFGIFVFALATLASFILIEDFAEKIFSRVSLTGFISIENSGLSNLLLPSAITSFIFSIIAIITMAFLIFHINYFGSRRVFPFKGYLTAISIIIVIFLLNYFITLFPYGNIVLNIISFVLQIMTYGVLLPYIFVAQITYIVLLLKGEIKGNIM